MRTTTIVAVAGALLLLGSPAGAGARQQDQPPVVGVGNPKRVCDRPFPYSDTTVVGVTRVECGVGTALVTKVFRANPDLPGPALPGWNCHGIKGYWFQGHCRDLSSPKRKPRIIHWWLNE